MNDLRSMLTAPIFALVLGLMMFTSYVGFSVGALEGAAYAKAHTVPEFIPMEKVAVYSFRGSFYD